MALQCFITLFLFFSSGLHLAAAHGDWTYTGENGPENWPGECATGTRQSPIDIVTDEAVKTNLGALHFEGYNASNVGTIKNTIHSVQISLMWPVFLKGADLPSTYILEQMHFHWDAEHTVDGVRNALELHFVHFNDQYGSVKEASQFENGIAVVTTLFELGEKENNNLLTILKAIPHISSREKMLELTRTIIPYEFLPKDHSSYYRYNGSLTTPGCQESVMWFILSDKQTISEKQQSIFKTVQGHNSTLVFNYRPVQPLGDRTIYHHIEGFSTAAISSSSLLYASLSLVLVKILSH